MGLYKPVLELAAETIADWADKPIVHVAGLAGKTQQVLGETDIALSLGYHAGLLSLAAFKSACEDEIIEHCITIASKIPLIGFYLQPAVGGRLLSSNFWRRFCEIDNVVAIKMAPFNRYQTLDVIRGLPYLFSGMKVATVLAVAGAIVGEFIASEEGLGYLMLQVQVTMDTAAMFMGVLLITLIEVVLYMLVIMLEYLVVGKSNAVN